MKEKLSYSEAARRFEINDHKRVAAWERIYLEEGPEGFVIERRGRGSKSHPPKQLSKEVEEDLLAEVQRLRAENEYLKNLQALFLEDERRQHSTESCKLRNGLLSAHRKAEIVYRSLFAPEWHSGEKFHTKLLATIVLYVSLHG